jgi:hypothetical protein
MPSSFAPSTTTSRRRPQAPGHQKRGAAASRPRGGLCARHAAPLILAILAATTEFHARWDVILGFKRSVNIRTAHWAEVKALNRRIALDRERPSQGWRWKSGPSSSCGRSGCCFTKPSPRAAVSWSAMSSVSQRLEASGIGSVFSRIQCAGDPAPTTSAACSSQEALRSVSRRSPGGRWVRCAKSRERRPPSSGANGAGARGSDSCAGSACSGR